MVSIEEFEIIQSMMDGKAWKRPKHSYFPYKGLVKCGTCGRFITLEQTFGRQKDENGNRKRYVYMHCTKQRKGDGYVRCSEKNVRQKHFEAKVKEFLASLSISPRFLEWAQKQLLKEVHQASEFRQKETKRLNAEYTRLTNEILNLVALKVKKPDLIDDEVFKSQMEELKLQRNTIDSNRVKISEFQDEAHDIILNALSFARVARQRFETGIEKERETILRCIGSKIILKNQEFFIEPHSFF